MSKGIVSIALCRVSTAEQALTGNSLLRQGQNVQKASETLEAPIIKIWSLDQSSKAGKNLKRKDLAEMLIMCKQNKSIKYLIVDEIDRFMRSIDELYYFEVTFREVGVTVWYASQPELNSKDTMAKLNKLFKVFQAEASNDERISKSTNGLRDRVRLGYYPFPVPQGYRKTNTPGLFEPDETRFALLQRSFREILTGVMPATALHNLTLAGYTQQNGKSLYLKRFMKILRCPYYAGSIRIEGWDFINDHGLHEKMIGLDEFEQLQAMLMGKKLKQPRRVHNPAYPLSNLMACSECGNHLVGFLQNNGKGKSYDRYKCRGCGILFHRDEVHGALNVLLNTVEIRENKQDELLKSLSYVWKLEQSEALGRVRLLETRMDTLKDEKKKYLLALANHPDLQDDYREAISEVEMKLEGIGADIRIARDVDQDLVEFTSFAFDFIKNQSREWWNLEFDDREKCKQLLFPRGFSINYAKTVYTQEISPLIRLKDTKTEPLNGSVNGMVEVAGVTPASKAAFVRVLHAQSQIIIDAQPEAANA